MTEVLSEPIGRDIGTKITIPIDFDVQKASLPEGQVEVIVSTPNTDRQGDRINIEGIDTKTMSSNAPVMWSHDYTTAPIGQITKLWKTAGVLKARVSFALNINPMADMVYQMVKAGFIKAVSIGGLVTEFGKKQDGTTDFNFIEKMQMIELSFCAIGANPEALVTLKSIEDEAIKTSDDHTMEAIFSIVKSLQTDVSALASSIEAARVPERQSDEKLVLAKSSAKQVDKQSELLIASINSLLEDKNGRNRKRRN